MNLGWGLGRCWGCGEPLVPNEVVGMCPPCQWTWPSLPGSEAVQRLAQERVGCAVFGVGFRLRPDTHRVVHRVKYGGFPSQGRALGLWMAQGWPAPPRDVVLVPVPLHWRRHVRRGFNPPQALAEGLATGWGCEVHPKLLRRLKHRVSLTSATRAARLSALRGTYGVREDWRTARPERVVLVDDVLTTGATFRACQQVLGAEGVEVVGGVWLAMG